MRNLEPSFVVLSVGHVWWWWWFPFCCFSLKFIYAESPLQAANIKKPQSPQNTESKCGESFNSTFPCVQLSSNLLLTPATRIVPFNRSESKWELGGLIFAEQLGQIQHPRIWEMRVRMLCMTCWNKKNEDEKRVTNQSDYKGEEGD